MHREQLNEVIRVVEEEIAKIETEIIEQSWDEEGIRQEHKLDKIRRRKRVLEKRLETLESLLSLFEEAVP